MVHSEARLKEQKMKEVIRIRRLVLVNPFRVTPCGQHGSERGQGIVEFALALPFLMLIMLGTIDMGRMFFDYIDLRSAAVDGAQYGSRNPANAGAIQAAALASGAPAGTTVTVAVDAACNSATTPGVPGSVTVTTAKTFQPFTTAFLSRFGLGPVNLSASNTMRCLT
jgi:Flp pilus assembly protein TadG